MCLEKVVSMQVKSVHYKRKMSKMYVYNLLTLQQDFFLNFQRASPILVLERLIDLKVMLVIFICFNMSEETN